MARWLYDLARSAARRRRLVLAIWIGLLVVVGVLGTTLRGELSNSFSIPGIEAQGATDLLADEFPTATGGTYRVVFAAPDGGVLTSPGAQAAIANGLEQASTVDGVLAVTPITLSQDQSIGFADVQFAAVPESVPDEAKDGVSAAMDAARAAGLQVEFGGSASVEQVSAVNAGEALGIVVALVVLLITLGSLVAAGLPLLTALIGVGLGVLGIQIVSGFVDLSSITSTLALMIGLAVGIDYALFIVARYRSQLADPDMSVDESIGRAIGTAGSAVVFAGLTVIIALAALTIAGIPFLSAMGLAAAGTVAVAVIVALTLIPALLGFAGERLRPRPTERGLAPSVPSASASSARPTLWLRWARLIHRVPALFVVVPIGLLLVLAVPALNLRLGLPGNETLPEDTTQYQSYQLLTEGFGPGFNATILYVVDGDGMAGTDLRTITTSVAEMIRQDADVAMVGEPTFNEDQSVGILSVVPRTGPDDEATSGLVERLRGQPRELVEQAGGIPYVGGLTPTNIDVSAKLADALPLFIVVIVLLAVILLMVAFRSILVPLKAVVGFLLTIGTSLGLTVWVFQDGHLADLLGVTTPAPIVSFIPVLLIGILFGLSMDYEVFLVSRMREEFHHTGNATEAVLRGLAESGRVVCAAALIMASVFAGFLLGDDVIVKSIAFALIVGVLIDAFVVRMTIVPAVMFLLGERAWGLPRWLDRIVPNVDIEGASLPAHGPETGSEPATNGTASRGSLPAPM